MEGGRGTERREGQKEKGKGQMGNERGGKGTERDRMRDRKGGGGREGQTEEERGQRVTEGDSEGRDGGRDGDRDGGINNIAKGRMKCICHKIAWVDGTQTRPFAAASIKHHRTRTWHS